MTRRIKKPFSVFVAFAMIFTLFSGVVAGANENLDSAEGLAGAGLAFAQTTYTLTLDEVVEEGVVKVNGDEWDAGDEDEFDADEDVQLEAEPSAGYAFKAWEINDETVTAKAYTLTMDEDKNVTAVFEPLASYSTAASSIISYDGEVEINEANEFEMRFRRTDGSRINYADDGPVKFEIHFDGDASEIIIARDYGEVLEGTKGDEEWVLLGKPDAGMVEFDIITSATGTVEVTAYRGPGDTGKIDEAEFEVRATDEINRIELDIDSYRIEAGSRVELTATAYDNGWEVEGERIKFEMKKYDDGWDEDDFKSIGTVRTNSDGEAELRYRLNKTGQYRFRAVWDKDDDVASGISSTVTVYAGPSDRIEADKAMDFHDIDEDTFEVIFFIYDEHGNAVEPDSDDSVDIFKKIEFRVTDPDGDRYNAKTGDFDTDELDVDFCFDDEEFILIVDYSEIDIEGDYEVRARIAGTTQSAFTTVTAKAFGDVVDMRLTLDPAIVHEDQFEDDDDVMAYDDWLVLIDEYGMEKDYNTRDRDVIFSSSRGGVATIARHSGDITIRNTGETVITASHADEGFEASDTLYVGGDPAALEIVPDIQVGELSGVVTMYLLDEDDYRTQRKDGRDVEYSLSRVPNALTISNMEDFEEGVATFDVEADDFGLYEGLRVITEDGLTQTFALEFVEDMPVMRRTVVMTIGSTSYTLNGEQFSMDVAPYIDEQTWRTLVPYRFAAEAALDADVSWDADERSVTVEKGDRVVVMFIGETYVYIDGVRHEDYLDQAPLIVDDRTMVPQRALAEAFGAVVTWDGDARTVTIEYDG